jgi:hypothetical protein
MCTNYSQAIIENYDPARLIIMFPRLVASMPPDPSGNFQVELWPASNVQQAFPWLGYTVPNVLVNDDDNFPAYMRVDAILDYASAQALRWRPRTNPDYSEAICMSLAKEKMQAFEGKLAGAVQDDEGLWRQDITYAAEMQLPLIDPYSGSWATGGAMLAAMSAVGNEDW